MINPEQIPDEVVWKLHDKLWEVGNPSVAEARTAIAAAINAWPGVKLENLCSWVMDGPDLPYVEETASIILPLSTEARDE